MGDSLCAEVRARPAPAGAQILSALLVVCLVAGLALSYPPAAAPETDAEVWVDPAEARVIQGPAWVDPRWMEHLAAILERTAPLEVGAEGKLADLGDELAKL